MKCFFRIENDDGQKCCNCITPSCIHGDMCCKCKPIPDCVKNIKSDLQGWNKEVSTKVKNIKWEKTARNEKTQEYNFDNVFDLDIDFGWNRKETYKQTLENNKYLFLKEKGWTLFGMIVVLLIQIVKFFTLEVLFPGFDVFTDCNATVIHFK